MIVFGLCLILLLMTALWYGVDVHNARARKYYGEDTLVYIDDDSQRLFEHQDWAICDYDTPCCGT